MRFSLQRSVVHARLQQAHALKLLGDTWVVLNVTGADKQFRAAIVLAEDCSMRLLPERSKASLENSKILLDK